jgi:hypothetical protein
MSSKKLSDLCYARLNKPLGSDSSPQSADPTCCCFLVLGLYHSIHLNGRTISVYVVCVRAGFAGSEVVVVRQDKVHVVTTQRK